MLRLAHRLTATGAVMNRAPVMPVTNAPNALNAVIHFIAEDPQVRTQAYALNLTVKWQRALAS
jgi:hypothetical protein